MARFELSHASSRRSSLSCIDYLTKKLAGVINAAQQKSSSFLRKSCRCGATVPDKTYTYKGAVIGAGAIHMIAYHRDEVPRGDLIWLEGLLCVFPGQPRNEDLG